MVDDELQAEVLNELRSEPFARTSRIHVRARNGTVTLSGQVSCFSEKQKLDAAALRAAGIKALDTQISIKRVVAVAETGGAPQTTGPAIATPARARYDPAAVVASAGLRSDVPRDVINAIVNAVEARAGSNVNEVRLALSNFNLSTLLKPGVTVEALAKGLTDLAHSDEWPALVRQCP